MTEASRRLRGPGSRSAGSARAAGGVGQEASSGVVQRGAKCDARASQCRCGRVAVAGTPPPPPGPAPRPGTGRRRRGWHWGGGGEGEAREAARGSGRHGAHVNSHRGLRRDCPLGPSESSSRPRWGPAVSGGRGGLVWLVRPLRTTESEEEKSN